MHMDESKEAHWDEFEELSTIMRGMKLTDRTTGERKAELEENQHKIRTLENELKQFQEQIKM